MNNQQIEIFATEYQASAEVAYLVEQGFCAQWHKDADGSYVVESWED